MYIYYFIDDQETTRAGFSACSAETHEIATLIRSSKEYFEPLEGSAVLHFETQSKSWSLDSCDQEGFRHVLETADCAHGELV
jgi:hypothetical protein